MKIKKNLREFVLIVLGILVMITPFVIFDTLLGWVEAGLGLVVVVVGAWPFLPLKKLEKLT